MSRPESTNRSRRAGFSLIELIMSVLVLAFGVVGLATTTLFITRQLTIAEVTTLRATATRSVMERLRATPYGSIASGGDTLGRMVVSWTVTANTPQTTTLDIVTLGPGRLPASAGQASMMSNAVADTVTYKVLRP